MSSAAAPTYLHLWNGQGYRIPSSFWSGTTAVWDNHLGQQFRFSRRTDGSIALYTPQGETYNFSPTHSLANITDTTGTNVIRFGYSGGHIQSIIDTLGRQFLFCYSGNLLHSINQTSGTCTSIGQSLRGVIYTYQGAALTK